MIFFKITEKEQHLKTNLIYINYIIFVYALLLLIVSCSKKNFCERPEYKFKSTSGKPDYSNQNFWAAYPDKWDPSDSIPKKIRNDCNKNKDVDVFFIYPTTFVDMNDERWNAPIDDAELNSKTDYTSILYQASVFNKNCKIYAPRYRQANLKVFFSSDTALSAKALELAYQDISTAFEYYLKNLNNGRPIIIAAHSQGTVHAARLLKEYFEEKPLQNRLVCAYLIGMPVRKDYFTNINSCKDSTSTGCIVSWRTFKNGYIEPKFIATEKYKCIVTNPLTWTEENYKASRKLNAGGVLKNFNKLVPGVVDAQIHNNILWTCKPRFFGNIFLTKKNYHIADINFFYINIRNNIATRINMFLKK